MDKDICLSILDYAVPAQEQEGTTPTRALNTLVNRVVRTVCVGSDEDLQVGQEGMRISSLRPLRSGDFLTFYKPR